MANDGCDPDIDRLPLLDVRLDEETPPSIAVIRAVSAVEDVDPAALPGEQEFVLNDYVDADALDRIIADNDLVSATIEFDLAGYRVCLDTSRRLVLRRLRD